VGPRLLIPLKLTHSMNVKEIPWVHEVFPVDGKGPGRVAIARLRVCPLEREEGGRVFSVEALVVCLVGVLTEEYGWVWVFYRGWWSELSGSYDCLFYS